MTPLGRIERLNLALLDIDELIVLLANADDILERNLWLAHATRVRTQLSLLIRAETSTPMADDDLKGFDC